MSTTIIRPAYYRVVERVGNTWKFRQGKPFYNPDRINGYSQSDIFTDYRLTLKKIAIELFRINGGKTGYYLANLRDRKYYYCGTEWENVKETLYSLGIGRKDNAAS